MAKARKSARGPARKRPAKKRTIRTAKLKGRKAVKPRTARAKPKRKGGLSGAMDTVTRTLREMSGLRRRMDRNTFEGQ
jgi:hypothetical protein